jgi:RimJ/RimL family protein N-acetyltransferase
MTEDKHIWIETPRLIIRSRTLADADDIQAAKEEVWPELQRWMSWAYDSERGRAALLRTIRQSIAKNDPVEFLIGRCKLSGAFVVSTGINLNDGHYETGYWVAKEFLGKGYATETANAVIRYAFNVMSIREMQITHYEDNDKSRNVIEKLGFMKLRTEPKAKARCLDGVLLDVHRYVMTDPSVLPPLDMRWGSP